MSNNINRRFLEHKSPKNVANKTTVLARAFRKYSVGSFNFEILELVNDINLLAEREVFWINELKPEYNMSEGGLGNKGRKLSDELKQMLSQIAKMQWQSKSDLEKQYIINNNLIGPKIGHPVSAETRQKLREKNLGKKQSAETIKKRSEKLKIAALNNRNGNKKVSIMLDGVVIETFESIRNAANKLNINPSNISKVLKGHQKTAGGYSWKYGV